MGHIASAMLWTLGSGQWKSVDEGKSGLLADVVLTAVYDPKPTCGRGGAAATLTVTTQGFTKEPTFIQSSIGAFSFSRSTVKLCGRCRRGYALKVSMNRTTIAAAPNARYNLWAATIAARPARRRFC
jgi:hypothetical protein